MKSIVAFMGICCAFAFITQIEALPFGNLGVDDFESHHINVAAAAGGQDLDVAMAFAVEPADNIRPKRATCDLLSFAGINHSACAAHCILKGKRGGYCDNHAVCVCRN